MPRHTNCIKSKATDILKPLWYTRKLKPAIHLDNRYRLMRHEPMLDANGNETNEIGEDDTISIYDLVEEEQTQD